MSEERIPAYMMVWRPDIGEFGAFVPVRGVARVVASKYEAGLGYLLEPAVLGSTPFERMFWAVLQNGWSQLRESEHATYPTSEHFRKRALIKAGFYRMSEAVFDTPADAARAGAIAQMDDEYSVVLVKGEVMRRFTAMSMKVRNKKDRDNFRTMADAVLALLADKIGVTVDDLIKSSQKDDH
ncbi:MAG: hypothetical protein JSS57_07515 [Proteobacteria bacterium]|nr:hypothetical protein [Pseudomonadota bacterium]